MRFFAVGQHAEGVIAIGQEATGFIALGQFATGVIAIGQVARGVIAVGQAALGVFAVGQVAVGLTFCLAMLGAGGRGVGLVLPIVPVPPRRKKLPALGTLEHALAKGSAWVRGRLSLEGGTALVATVEGRRAPVGVSADLFLAAYGAAKSGRELLLELTSGDRKSLRLRAMKQAVDDASPKPWLGVRALAQLALLAVVAWGYWRFFVVEFVDVLVRLAWDFSSNGIALS